MNTAQSPAHDPFITHPREPAPARVRTVQSVVTLLAWLVYAWLWLPVVTVIAWMLGVRTSFVELYVRNYEFDQDTFGILFTLAVVATVILIGWAEYNRHKFGGHDRRAPASNATSEDIARSLRASPEVSGQLATAKSITLAMADDARPIGVHRHTRMSGLL
jgi:biofilm PGA synthesis protein PgaD